MGLWRNLLSPAYFPVVARKVVSRLTDRRHSRNAGAARRWCEEESQDFDSFARALDPSLLRESAKFALDLKEYAHERLSHLPFSLGGGGHYQLLYFLTRLMKPETVLETGVAAGFSSYAILSAMELNASGSLYSSDFPYFRLDDPTDYVGFLVPPSLRSRWHLYTKGDRENFKTILSQVRRIELVHYDSDKSYSGRSFAMRAVTPALAERAVVIMDDIQDNFFFRDYVASTRQEYRVFPFGGKFLGVTGL